MIKIKIKTENGHAQYALHKELRPDPGQPRQEFRADQMSELGADIEANGLQEPLSVRKDPESKTKWLINDGERRWRAAGLLSLERVPIVVREFADEAAVRAYQRIVGTQRLNLSDLEQAAALDRELKLRQKADPKCSITQLGEALGIARATIYESFKLLKLSPPVVAALKAGTLDASKARRFATVPVTEHTGLLKRVTKPDWHGEVMSVRDLDKLIAEEYSRQLSAAPWKLADADLVKAAGPCTTCPKRSGNLEGMGGSPNVCTDVKCYETKQAAHTARVLAEAEKDGRRISVTNYAGSGRTTADKAREKKEKAMKAAAMLAAPKILERCQDARGPFWQFLAEATYHATDITRHDFVAKRRGLSKTINESREALEKWLKQKHTPNEYAGLVVDLLLCAQWQGGGWHECKWSKEYQAIAKLAGVNLEKLMKIPKHPNTQTPEKPSAHTKAGKALRAFRARKQNA